MSASRIKNLERQAAKRVKSEPGQRVYVCWCSHDDPNEHDDGCPAANIPPDDDGIIRVRYVEWPPDGQEPSTKNGAPS